MSVDPAVSLALRLVLAGLLMSAARHKLRQRRAFRAALARGEYAYFDSSAAGGLAIVSILLGVATVAIVLAG